MLPVEKAFEKFCRDETIKAAFDAVGEAHKGVFVVMAKNAFVGGAKYATERCKAAGH